MISKPSHSIDAEFGEVLAYFTRRCLAPPDNFQRVHGIRPDHTACVVYFLLDLAFDPHTELTGLQDLSALSGVDPFIQHTLPRLLQQLSHSTDQHPVQYHAQVRGRILWNATYKARLSEEYDPAKFVCAEVRQRYDNPENQLLKYLLEQIEKEIKAIPQTIRDGRCILPQGEERLPEDASRRLEALETAILRLKRNVRLREITSPDEINERHKLRAGTSRTEEYSNAVELYYQYERMVLRPSWHSLAAAARHILPLPARLDETTRSWVDLAADLRNYPL